MRHPPLHCGFSIIENFELMQTINNKRKYKFQELFKVLSLSLNAGLESFHLLVNGDVNDGHLAVSPRL